ncbi:MAG: efflux RND transporter periplasmic adaptor subunit [Acidobacteriia bacterium]|nr:efflux RND transporter periplasmic adaptor subunit [Terriglobia bacterium]
MRFSDQPGSEQTIASEDVEARLRQEIADLKRQLAQKTAPHTGHGVELQGRPQGWRPSALALWCIFLVAAALIVAAFFAGYIPWRNRNAVIRAEAKNLEQSLPRVEVLTVERAGGNNELELPGSIQAITEAPILARADGYIRSRTVDIGDRVRAGQPVAEIEAPELDQQVRQAKANLEQAQAALEQARANQEQGRSNEELARVTAERWQKLMARGAVSKQENDQYQAQYKAQVANLEALAKAVAAAQSNVGAAEANLARLNDMQSYRVVRAPFDGLITQRNVDVGALVNAGSTLLFRIAQTGTLRTYVDVPQSYEGSVRVGQPALLSVPNLPGRHFPGTVTRTSNSLDPSSRTMLVEVQVPNHDGALLPGMYARVDLSGPRAGAAVLVPGDSVIIRADGTQVAVVDSSHTVHLQKVEIGRDYGDRLEVVNGLHPGDTIIANPGDSAKDGAVVNPVAATPSKPKR